jgi:hypothetical protein
MYRDVSNGKHMLADANDVLKTNVVGLAITPGLLDEHGVLATNGDVELVGSTLTKGASYYLGPTPGQLIPEGDLTTGYEVVRVGTAVSTTRLRIKIDKTGIVI